MEDEEAYNSFNYWHVPPASPRDLGLCDDDEPADVDECNDRLATLQQHQRRLAIELEALELQLRNVRRPREATRVVACECVCRARES